MTAPKLVGCFSFAMVNGAARYLSGGVPDLNANPLPFLEIAFLQNCVSVLCILPFMLKGGSVSFKVSHVKLYSILILTSMLGLFLWYGALAYLPLAQAAALAFTGPVFTVIGAWVFLKESLNHIRLSAIFLSFFGAYLIVRPDQILESDTLLIWYTSLPLLSALVWSVSKIVMRQLAKAGEPAKRVALYNQIFVIPVSLIPVIPLWVTPTFEQSLWIMSIGIVACIGYVASMKAFEYADVTFLTPFNFLRLFLSGVVGYVAFDELPQGDGFIWGAVIILGSLALLNYEGRAKKTLERKSA